MVRALAARADLPRPELYIIDEPQCNALAVGHSPSQSALVLTTGALRKFTGAELASVIGHELTHINIRESKCSRNGQPERCIGIGTHLGSGATKPIMPRYRPRRRHSIHRHAAEIERREPMSRVHTQVFPLSRRWQGTEQEREGRNGTVRDLWLACCAQEEIAERVGMPQRTVSDVLAENESFRFPLKPGSS
jgi:hypothetical protein